MMIWNEFALEVHANAVAHGWWDEPKPSFAAQIALMHSELSEALDAWRRKNGAPGETQQSGFAGERTSSGMSELSALAGSEGYGACEDEVAVELADCVLRILDTLAACGQACEPVEVAYRFDFCAFICRCHEALQNAWHMQGSMRDSQELSPHAAQHLVGCIALILAWAEANGVDMEAVLRAKHEYNKTRPRRHGGKVV